MRRRKGATRVTEFAVTLVTVRLEKWPACSEDDNFSMMHFGEEIQAAPQAHRDRLKFWSRDADRAAAH